MAPSRVLKLACLMVLTLVLLGSPEGTNAEVSCGQVVRYLMPCVSYVTNGGTVPTACCSGIQTLYGLATTTDDRRSVCACLKNAISGISYNGNNVALAEGLPAKCGLSLPYKISPSTDCSSVN